MPGKVKGLKATADEDTENESNRLVQNYIFDDLGSIGAIQYAEGLGLCEAEK
jgi:hypothetical protein